MYFGTEDRSEKSVRAEAGRVSRTWGKHDQSGANFEAWSRITSNVERSWKTRLKNPSEAKASGAIKSTAAGFMDMDAEATESFECYGEQKQRALKK